MPGHEVVFLDGEDSCSGRVGIEKSNKNYWLSGSNSTWNQESADAVCRQMHCGSASNYSLVPVQSTEEKNSFWNKSYRCAPNTTSLFKCEKESSLPADHKNETATVNCSGKIRKHIVEIQTSISTISAIRYLHDDAVVQVLLTPSVLPRRFGL